MGAGESSCICRARIFSMSIETQIIRLIEENLAPEHLEVVNESHMHRVPPNSETHFKLTLVSPAFEGLRQVGRHQRVYAVLQPLIGNPIHALALHTYTPNEWAVAGGTPASPPCMGGQSI